MLEKSIPFLTSQFNKQIQGFPLPNRKKDISRLSVRNKCAAFASILKGTWSDSLGPKKAGPSGKPWFCTDALWRWIVSGVYFGRSCPCPVGELATKGNKELACSHLAVPLSFEKLSYVSLVLCLYYFIFVLTFRWSLIETHQELLVNVLLLSLITSLIFPRLVWKAWSQGASEDVIILPDLQKHCRKRTTFFHN